MKFYKMKPINSRAFTLIELLTVIAIIGILAAIIIPTVGAVKTSANKAKTKVQFNQWATAIGLFKQDYGFYPYFSGSTSPTSDVGVTLKTSANAQMFVDVLAGKKPDGTAISGNALTLNKRRSAYYSFSDSELVSNAATVSYIKDAFGNADIVVAIDYNNDGLVTSGTSTTVLSGNSEDGFASTGYAPASSVIPTGGIRAGVVFYSPGKGSSQNDIVTSW